MTIQRRQTAGILAAGAVLIGVSAAPSYAQVKLKTTAFPDGTGSIGLAPGWKLDGVYNGACQCVGPNGSAVVLKMPWTIVNPQSSVAQLPSAAQQPMAPRGNLVAALREVVKKKVNGTLLKVRGKRLADVSPGSPAYLLFYEYTQNGKTYAAMGYFAALDYGPDQPAWQLYSSAIIAPKAQFAKMVPTMIAIWKSWRPNGQPPREGSASAIFDKMMKDHRDSYDRIQQEFRENL